MPSAPDFFALFDIIPTLRPNPPALRKRFYELSRQYHPDRFPANDKAAQQEALNQTAILNKAYLTLSDEDALLGYVLRREGVVEDEEHYQLPPDFLMEMMELNEAIGEGSGQTELAQALESWETGMAPLRDKYDSGARDTTLLAAMKDYYFRKKYLQRIKGRLA